MAQFFAFVIVQPGWKAKSSKGGFSFKFRGKSEGNGAGLWPRNGFSVLISLKIQRGNILGGTSHLTHKLLLFFCQDVPFQSHNEDFPHPKVWGLKQSDKHPHHSKFFCLHSKKIFKGEGCRVGVLSWSSTLQRDPFVSSEMGQRGTIGIIPSPLESSCHKFFSSSHGRKMGRVVGYSTWDNCLNVKKVILVLSFHFLVRVVSNLGFPSHRAILVPGHSNFIHQVAFSVWGAPFKYLFLKEVSKTSGKWKRQFDQISSSC